MDKMKVARTIAPGQHGAVREHRRYGDRLRYVRYLSDSRGRYIKTVELVVNEWNHTH